MRVRVRIAYVRDSRCRSPIWRRPLVGHAALAVTQSDHDGVVVVSVTGDVDLATAPWLRQQLLQLLWNRPAGIVLTLEEVPFMDAAGLHAVEVVDRYARMVGTGLRIAGPSRLVRKMLVVTSMDNKLAVFPILLAALAGQADPPTARPA